MNRLLSHARANAIAYIALFIALAKRRHELVLLLADAIHQLPEDQRTGVRDLSR